MVLVLKMHSTSIVTLLLGPGHFAIGSGNYPGQSGVLVIVITTEDQERLSAVLGIYC